MESSSQQFKDNLKKQYSDALGVKSDAAPQLTLDYTKFASSIKEEDDLNLSKDNLKMVKGIADIVNQVKDLENKKEIANKMIKDFKKQNIKFDYKEFLKMCNLSSKVETKENLIVKPVSKKFVDKILAKNGETIEATGSGSSGAYSAPLFSGEEPDLNKIETKEQKRRRTMKASKEVKRATNNEGNTFKVGDKAKTYDRKEDITIRALWEKNGRTKAFYMVGNNGHEIDIDGLDPIKEQVEKVETKEATTSGSVGGYETPAMWAKSTKKKDWGPSRKTQIPGGGFVKIKKKCTKFPYCNQGDINSLKITKNESVKEAIKNVSKKLKIGEGVITTILEYEYEKNKKSNK